MFGVQSTTHWLNISFESSSTPFKTKSQTAFGQNRLLEAFDVCLNSNNLVKSLASTVFKIKLGTIGFNIEYYLRFVWIRKCSELHICTLQVARGMPTPIHHPQSSARSGVWVGAPTPHGPFKKPPPPSRAPLTEFCKWRVGGDPSPGLLTTNETMCVIHFKKTSVDFPSSKPLYLIPYTLCVYWLYPV